MPKTRHDVIICKQLFVGGHEIVAQEPPVLAAVEDSDAATVRDLREDFNDLLDSLREAGVIL